MKRTALIISLLVLGAATAGAETFRPATYLADAGVEVLTRDAAQNLVGRDLFGAPWATVVVGNVDIYDRFPYVEAHNFQIVSDPAWNRLLMGEVGRDLTAFDGSAGGFGSLSSPRGLSSDGMGRVYLADTGNDRVLVFRASSEFDRLTLVPLYAIEGLAKPFDVAFSDGGTPFDAGDDCLYVANTGRNEVRRYELDEREARLAGSIGELGSGDGRFAGPMAITVGRTDGVHNTDVYVSDAHNGRVVLLRDTGGSLAWTGASTRTSGTVTSLDCDHWGNVYAASPQSGSVTKFTASLIPVAAHPGGDHRPRGFHVPFANVTDHRTGRTTRAGQGSGIVVEEWNSEGGLRMLNLGTELKDAAAIEEESAAVRMTLTDHSRVTATITDPSTGRVVARHDAGVVGAGPQSIRFAEEDFVSGWSTGEFHVTVRATSTYDEDRVSEAAMTITLEGSGGPAVPGRLALLGNSPNPFNPSTMIRFTVPSGPVRPYSLRVYDVRGSLVRDLASGDIGAGLHEVMWNGHDNYGTTVGSGIYLYRLEVGREHFTGKMVMLK